MRGESPLLFWARGNIMKKNLWKPRSLQKIVYPDNGFTLFSSGVTYEGEMIFLFSEEVEKKTVSHVFAGEVVNNHLNLINKGAKLIFCDINGQILASLKAHSELYYAIIDATSDGKFALINCRCEIDDKNSIIFDSLNEEALPFCFDDAIEEVFIDKQNRIWVSYFDEACIYGLVCFSDRGKAIWRHNIFDGVQPNIDCCYSLNVSEYGIWFYFYGDFLLGRVNQDFSVEYFECPIKQYSKVVTNGEMFVFISMYAEPSALLCTLPLNGDELLLCGQIEIALPDQFDINKCEKIARGKKLYLFTEREFAEYDMDDLIY